MAAARRGIDERGCGRDAKSAGEGRGEEEGRTMFGRLGGARGAITGNTFAAVIPL